ncbi:MAG: GAF domain-containing protein [Actinobacteria bacterium]|nr:GAF domain-containing protein [Actinomycetota bacterium]
MTTYLSVQIAARKLGVSPHTIRRWTASGFLPCTRTPGGHRRIKQEDVEELLTLVKAEPAVAARSARERELETLMDTSLALSRHLDLSSLIAEIARHMTRLLDCDRCAISEYDRETQMITMLAFYERDGRRIPEWEPYPLKRFPTLKYVFGDLRMQTVNVSDRHADAAYLAYLRRSDLKSTTLVPLVSNDRPMGLLELEDRSRERRYSPQELRICRSVAAQAAVALDNAKLVARLRRSSTGLSQVCFSMEKIATAIPRLVAHTSTPGLLKEAATLACEALSASSSVASYDDQSAGAAAPRWRARRSGGLAVGLRSDTVNLLTATAPCHGRDLVVTATLQGPATDGQTQLLTLVCSAAASALTTILHEERT